MHYKFHAGLVNFISPLLLVGEAFSRAEEGEQRGLSSALEMAQEEEEEETPSPLSLCITRLELFSGQQSTAFIADQNVLNKVEVEQLF